MDLRLGYDRIGEDSGLQNLTYKMDDKSNKPNY